MSFLTREDAKAAVSMDKVEVDVTELGPTGTDGKPRPTTVFVRALTAREKDLYESSFIKIRKGKRTVDMSDARARLAVLCCVQPDGTPVFKPDDVAWLTHKSAKALSRIYDAAKQLNEISDEDEEELIKNSEATPTCDS